MALIRHPMPADFSNTVRELERARREMDRFFAGFTGKSTLPSRSGVFPPLNVSEDGEKILVQAEVPGIKPEEIDISIEGNTLVLRGERKPDEAEGVSYHRRERKAGSFHKAVTLPSEVNPDKVTAECKDGVLTLVLPKAEHAKPKKISVKVE